VLHYQPKVDTATRRIDSVEALIRWQSPELGLVPPCNSFPCSRKRG
jgi:EAL domain-containing protein (putative c-di-GMP-specific phosphodiesterase class I)